MGLILDRTKQEPAKTEQPFLFSCRCLPIKRQIANFSNYAPERSLKVMKRWQWHSRKRFNALPLQVITLGLGRVPACVCVGNFPNMQVHCVTDCKLPSWHKIDVSYLFYGSSGWECPKKMMMKMMKV